MEQGPRSSAPTDSQPAIPARHSRVFIRAASLVLLLVASIPGPTQAAQLWPTTNFQVFVNYPDVSPEARGDEIRYDAMLGERTVLPPSRDAIEALETALHEAAEWYENNDFPAPAIRPLVETDQGLAYRIYVCFPGDNAKCSHPGAFIRDCGDGSRADFIYMRQDMVFTGSELQEQGYHLTETGAVTAVHELMHAIIKRTALGQSLQDCQRDSPARWISEGIPEAIAQDLVRSRHFTVPYRRLTTSEREMERVGYRPYSETLDQHSFMDRPGKNCPLNNQRSASDEEWEREKDNCFEKAGYKTSSFWRYLERAHDRGLTYAYLVKPKNGKPGLLQRRIPIGQVWERDVYWVDEGLKGQFKQGLRPLYSLFVNDFALRVPSFETYRARLRAANTPAARESAKEKNLQHWLKQVFEDCHQVDLELNSP
ncbi:MAG: hypothetical protein HKN58_02320, partial [Xanthomonadales bacterium]|nr:hypothetical protein [Xanthomonadales bacterium]